MYRIVQSHPSPQKIRRRLPLAALDRILPDRDIEAICRRVGHRWRRRKLPPGLLVRSMVHRGLHPDHSIAGMLTELAALWGPEGPAPSDAAWCRARSRLPEAVLTDLIARCARRCRRQFGRPFQWHERWVFRADGSTVSMPDEPSLVAAFGYADTRQGPSRFPVARVTFLELAGSNVIWDYRLGHYTDSEEAQFYGLWGCLPRGSIVLLDRKFCSFYILAKLRRRRIDVITPLHQRRDPHRLIAQGHPLVFTHIFPLRVCRYRGQAQSWRIAYADQTCGTRGLGAAGILRRATRGCPANQTAGFCGGGFGRGIPRHVAQVLWRMG